PAGESIALWGPNGAGKTTVVRCILGLVSFDGTVEVDGLDVRTHGKAVRARLGYVPQELSFYDEMTVLETLDFSAALRRLGPERVDEVLEMVDLEGHHDKRVRELSGGLKQRLGIAAALLPDPPILLLDEPTSNLDAGTRESAVELLDELREDGRSLIVTSHHLEEVGMLVDRVIAMEGGRISIECSPAELADRLGLRAWLHLVVPDGAIPKAVSVLREGGFDARQNSYGVLVEVSAQGKGEAIGALQRAGVGIEDVEV
ncbi:MAG: ABC transporter ATP-binding protein, partial [Actinobacteria bacterium]|nr:ABC transporter ATP-binding protein [Actinomycetota bacterium]NIS32441.1 ABC transporter ATP-binding protein [Actinomycetota bacterium]NIU19945.1 ABC transporter ATP-binding protein [Actinomycetota bacterium]NIU67463.1 ABC transporter ATP-binding protein [Actinomycetota bacterium]NIW29237.1 ATP-binding cassette domain-containing protein [Actinomycetota bacterium]